MDPTPNNQTAPLAPKAVVVSTAPPADYAETVRAAWAVAKPQRRDYGAIVTELNSALMVGEGEIYERGPYVPITHMGFFKPPADAFLSEPRSRDPRSAKEWEYLNAVGVWAELSVTALEVATTHSGWIDDMMRRLVLAEDSLKAALEVMAMRTQYFKNRTEQGVDIAMQMSFLVEQNQDAVFSESHRSARTILTSKMESEAAKMIAKAMLERASTRGGGQGGPSAAAQLE